MAMKTLRMSGSTSKISERDFGGLRFDLILDRFSWDHGGNRPSSACGRREWAPALAAHAGTLNQMLPDEHLGEREVLVPPLRCQNGTLARPPVANSRFQTQPPGSSRMSLMWRVMAAGRVWLG